MANSPSTDPGRAIPAAPTLYGPGSNLGTPTKPALTPAAVNSSVADILGLQSDAIKALADAKASRANATGNAAEAAAYDTAAGVAEGNAGLEVQLAGLTKLQQERQIRRTLGTEQADVASAGFAESGTNIAAWRDSIRQGFLTTTLTDLQGQISAGGYLAEAAASHGLSAAASGSSAAQTDAAAAQEQLGAMATTNSTNLMSTLLQQLNLPANTPLNDIPALQTTQDQQAQADTQLGAQVVAATKSLPPAGLYSSGG